MTTRPWLSTTRHAKTARVASVLALSLILSTTRPTVQSQEPRSPEAAAAAAAAATPTTVCPFCQTSFRTKDEFCSRCGRLSRLTATSPEHRFWGDAFYAEFTRWTDRPKLEANLGAGGLVDETVTFESGDRLKLSKTKKGIVIEGRVGGSEVRKEDSYKATVSEKTDVEDRLIQRSVWAKRNGDPDTHLYRVIDYKYDADGLLDRIEFVTKIYLGASDWEKKPAAWIRNSGGEIVMTRDGGALRAVETKVRTYKRSLRGEPELGEEKTIREKVLRKGDLVDAIVPEDPPAR